MSSFFLHQHRKVTNHIPIKKENYTQVEKKSPSDFAANMLINSYSWWGNKQAHWKTHPTPIQ